MNLWNWTWPGELDLELAHLLHRLLYIITRVCHVQAIWHVLEASRLKDDYKQNTLLVFNNQEQQTHDIRHAHEAPRSGTRGI